MNISTKHSIDGTLLILEGELTISEGTKLKEALKKHLDRQKPIEVNLEKITKIDTSGLQLLYAAHQTALREGGSFSLNSHSPAFLKAATLTGLSMNKHEGYLEGGNWKGGVKE